MDNHTSHRIVRDPIPAPMPRRLEPRLAWLDHLAWCVAKDVATTYGELREAGWTAEGAAECAGEGFVGWVGTRLAHAAEVGLIFAMAADKEAA